MTDLRLARLTLERAMKLIALRNDPEVQTHLRNQDMVGEDQQIEWWNWLKNHRQQDVRMFAVQKGNIAVRPSSDDPIEQWQLLGCAGLTTIDWQNRRAELSVYTVPQTYEIEAAHLILRHAFNDLGLHKIEAETLTERRFTLCADLGFSCEGSRRHAYWRAGQFIDSTRWGLLAKDWKR